MSVVDNHVATLGEQIRSEALVPLQHDHVHGLRVENNKSLFPRSERTDLINNLARRTVSLDECNPLAQRFWNLPRPFSVLPVLSIKIDSYHLRS